MVATRSRARVEAAEDVAMVEAYNNIDTITPPTLDNGGEAISSPNTDEEQTVTDEEEHEITISHRKSKIVEFKCTPTISSAISTILSTRKARRRPKASKPKGVVKKNSQREKKELAKKSFKIVLQIKYYNITPAKLRKLDKTIRPKRMPKGYFPYPGKTFKLGHNPWEHFNLPKPSEEDVRRVHRLLADHHQTFEYGTFVSQPAHAVKATVTIDAVIQTIFAQSSGNEMAIDVHSRLCNRYTYLVDGQKYVGTIPNWHNVRKSSQEDLEKVLKPGGYQVVRAKNIKRLLDMVYAENETRKAAGTQQYENDENPPDATNFVPGMLSLDYILDVEDDNDEKLLGRLLGLPLIGFKSAMCIMAFQLKRPLFVVDTHVLRYMKWLGWIPRHAKEDPAAEYLHSIIPDDIKYDLHNQIWTHCANENVRESRGRQVVCHFCGSNPPARGTDTSSIVCPLKNLLPPLSKRWGREYSEELKDEEELSDATIKREDASDVNSPTTEVADSPDAMAVDSEIVTVETTEVSVKTTVKKKMTKKQTTLEAYLGTEAKSDTSDSNGSSQISIKSVRVKKLKLRETMLFDELTPEQANAAGYLLWEFRPMDNSFMEEWGTFDKMPRYKWEKPTIMDPDVAVTPEYARKVLAGEVSHRWSKKVE